MIWLNDIRMLCGISVEELSDKLNISYGYMGKILSGDVIPSKKIIRKIQKIFLCLLYEKYSY